jgi:hypothetical protein
MCTMQTGGIVSEGENDTTPARHVLNDRNGPAWPAASGPLPEMIPASETQKGGKRTTPSPTATRPASRNRAEGLTTLGSKRGQNQVNGLSSLLRGLSGQSRVGKSRGCSFKLMFANQCRPEQASGHPRPASGYPGCPESCSGLRLLLALQLLEPAQKEIEVHFMGVLEWQSFPA